MTFGAVLIALVVHATPTPEPPHIVVEDSPWLIASALGSIIVAVATVVLASFTYMLARETVESVKASRESTAAEDTRHKNGFIPHIVLQLREEVRERTSTSGLINRRLRSLKLYARNIGAGLARNIVVEHRNAAAPAVTTEPNPLALGIGQEVLLATKNPNVAGDIADYRLIYEDAFGRRFESRLDGVVTLTSRYTWQTVGWSLMA